jgi:drug/metabolite transporter (DMT)-like permease
MKQNKNIKYMSNSVDPSSSRSRYWLGAAMIFLSAIAFSAKAVLIKIMYRDYPMIDASATLMLRMMFSLPFYMVVAFSLARRSQNQNISLNDWAKVTLLGIVGYYAASILDFMGLAYISASVERLILFVYPTIVLLMTALVFKRKITGIQYFALFLTYTGIALAFVDDVGASQQKNLPLGATFIFLSAFTYAIYLVFSGELIPKVGSMKFTCYAMLAAGVVAIGQYFLANGFDKLATYPAGAYQMGFLIAMISTVIPTFLTAEGINRVGSGNASLMSAIGPVATIILANIFLDERITLLQSIGTAIVLAGVLIISTKGKK